MVWSIRALSVDFLDRIRPELAEECKKRHQIVRNFLVAIGVDEETAEQDAEGVEHHVSAQTLKCFKAFLQK